MSPFLYKFMSRKFLLALGSSAVTSFLTYAGKIDGSVYATVILGTVGAFISGELVQKIKVPKEPAP